MPNIKLVYFNGEGRGELIRLIFAQGNVKYTDERIEGKDWPAVKESGRFPFQQMPVLEVDGSTIAQSGAIVRYAARVAGLTGKTSLEQARAEQVLDCLGTDLFEKMVQFLFLEKDETKKEELKKKFAEETVPKGMSNLEALVEKAGGEYFVGYLTYADIAFYRFINAIKGTVDTEGLTKKFPKLTALYDRVAALPNIKKWEETKPKS